MFTEYISQFKKQAKLGEVILVRTGTPALYLLLSLSSQVSVSLDVKWA